MSIRTATLATAPTLYWPLDDATGPAAADASGNGNPGVYSGAFSLLQPGPEAGTFGVLFSGIGEAFSFAASPVLVAPWTLQIWVAALSLIGNGAGAVYNGNGNANGSGLVLSTGSLGANQINLLRGGVASFLTGFNLPDLLWHQLTVIRDAVPNIEIWVDGQVIAPLQAGGGINALGGTDKFHAGPGIIGSRYYAAHAALWNVVLTQTQIQSITAGRVSPQEPSVLQGQTSADLASLIAFVSRTYQNAP